MEMLKEKISSLGKHLINGITYVLILTVGIIGGVTYTKYQIKSENPQGFHTYETPKEVSVAIKETGDFMLVNKNDGTYRTYDKEIGHKLNDFYMDQRYSKPQPTQTSEKKDNKK